MAALVDLFSALHTSPELSSPAEIKAACELIIQVQAMNSGERDCIRACVEKGPIDDGDVPSKSARDVLVDRGYVAKVIVRGMDGYNAATYKGAAAYRLIKVGA